MLSKLVFLFSIVGTSMASCPEQVLGEKVCAILYDKDDCAGGLLHWEPLELAEGEQDLPFKNNNDAESVKVNKGCSFRGYDHDGKGTGISLALGLKSAEELIEDRGDFIVVNSPGDERAWTNFKGDIREEITFVSCRCGNNGSCPVVPPYLCAIAYDKNGCGLGNWKHPLEVPVTNKMNLGFFTKFSFRNDIESVSVRKGCSFKGYDDSDLKGNTVDVVAPATHDLHKDLKDKKELANDIESMSCTCSS